MPGGHSRISCAGTACAFLKGRACSDTLFHVLSHAFRRPMELEERAAMPFAGGILQHGYQCGMIWGAALAAGARAYRIYGPGSQSETRSIIAAQGLMDAFRAGNRHTNCLEITDIDNSSSNLKMIMYFLVKGGTIGCIRRAAKYAPVAFREINASLSEEHVESPAPPVSCAAELARRMCASDLHAVMAAGFAGGIGLSGGACGALGAAIWIIGMNSRVRGGKHEFKDPRALEAVERFLKSSDYRFECAEIVGRRFETVEDHAAHVRSGGCSEIIEALAAR